MTDTPPLDDHPTPTDWYPGLLRHARRLVPAHAAEDLVQEVYLRLARRNPEQVTEAYLHTALKQVWVSDWRKSQVVPTVPVAEYFEDGVPESPDPALEVENRILVSQLLATLSADSREIVVLRHFHDLSFREIAGVLGRPLGTTLREYHEAKLSLRVVVSV